MEEWQQCESSSKMKDYNFFREEIQVENIIRLNYFETLNHYALIHVPEYCWVPKKNHATLLEFI